MGFTQEKNRRWFTKRTVWRKNSQTSHPRNAINSGRSRKNLSWTLSSHGQTHYSHPGKPPLPKLSPTLSEKKHLMNFQENPPAPISNNRAENAIRPFVIGRKGFLYNIAPYITFKFIFIALFIGHADALCRLKLKGICYTNRHLKLYASIHVP